MSIPLQTTVGADASNFLQAMTRISQSVDQTTGNAIRKFNDFGNSYMAAMNRTTDSSRQWADAQSNVGEQINNSTTALGAFTPILHTARGLLGALGITIGAFSAVNFVKGTIAGAESLNALNKQTGFTVENLSALKFAAEQEESSIDELVFGIRMLQRNLANADEDSKAARRGLSDLGFTANDIKAGMADLEGFVVKVSQRLNDIGNDSRRNQIQMQLFGRGGAALAGILQRLAREGFEGVRKEAEKFNAVVSTDFAIASDRFNDNLAKISSYLTGFARSVLAPVVIDFARFLDRLGLGTAQDKQIATIETNMIRLSRSMESTRLRIDRARARGDEKELAREELFLNNYVAEYRDFQDQLERMQAKPPKGKVTPVLDPEALRKQQEELAKMTMDMFAPTFKEIDEAEEKAISGTSEFNDIMKKLASQGLSESIVKMRDLDIEANKMVVTVLNNAKAAGMMDDDINNLIVRIREWAEEEKRVVTVNEQLKISIDNIRPVLEEYDKTQEEAVSLGESMNKVFSDLAKVGLTDTEKKLKDVDANVNSMIETAIRFGEKTGQSVDHILEKLEELRKEQKEEITIRPIAENLANSLTNGINKMIEGVMLGTRQDFKDLGRNMVVSIAQGISEEFIFKPMKAFMEGLFKGLLEGLVGSAEEDAENAGKKIGQAIRRGIGSVFGGRGKEEGGGGFLGFLSGAIGAAIFGGGSSTAAFGGDLGLLGGSAIPFAEGGIVPGPIGYPQPAIVHGGEQIIPVGGSFSPKVEVILYNPIDPRVFKSSPEEIAKVFIDGVEQDTPIRRVMMEDRQRTR